MRYQCTPSRTTWSPRSSFSSAVSAASSPRQSQISCQDYDHEAKFFAVGCPWVQGRSPQFGRSYPRSAEKYMFAAVQVGAGRFLPAPAYLDNMSIAVAGNRIGRRRGPCLSCPSCSESQPGCGAHGAASALRDHSRGMANCRHASARFIKRATNAWDHLCPR